MADQNFASFTDESSPALTDYAVGYRTATAGGERRILLSAIKALMFAGDIPMTGTTPDLINGNSGVWAGDSNLVDRGLYVQRDGTGLTGSPSLVLFRAGTNARSTVVDTHYAGGSLSSLSATPANATSLFRLRTYTGSAWVSPAAQLVFETTEIHSGVTQGTRAYFNTILTGTTTQVTPLELDGSGNVIMTPASGNVLIGTGSTSGLTGSGNLKVTNAIYMTGSNTILMESTSGGSINPRLFSDTASSAGAIAVGHARNTVASPSVLQSGDRLGSILFQGYGNGDWRNASAILATAAENFTSTYGSTLVFETTATGGTSRSEAMRITAAANVLVGTTSETGLSGAGGIKAAGDVYMSGSAKRFLGDFSNATHANRVHFKTSTTNGDTVVGAIPNGTSTIAGYRVYGNPDPDNSTSGILYANGGATPGVVLESKKFGTGTLGPLIFAVEGVIDARLSTSGNFLIGTTSDTGLSGTGNLRVAGVILTGAPSGGTAATWKLGTVASVSPTSPNRTIEVEIAGTTYYISAKTTNN